MSAVVAATALALLGYNGINQPQTEIPKLAYINSTVIISQAPGAGEAQATFEREMARWEAEIQAMSDSLQEMLANYDQQQIMLSPERRTERQREIELKQMEYQQRTADLEQVAQTRQQELVAPVFENIRNVLMNIRIEQGYSMIFDAAAGALIDADTTLDITPLVIERLQAQAAPGGSPSN
jgi:outer membrane protein